MVQLEILSGKSANQIVLVRRFPFVVGREPSSDLHSEDVGVWDAHFEIDYRARDGFFLVPNDATTTLIDAEPVSSPARLQSGAEISAGALNLRFNLADPVLRSYRGREVATWLAVAALVAFEIWLVFVLPR